MTWVRIDDAALSHPKVARAGVDGFGLWMGSLAYANRHVTDGFIPSDCLSLLVPSSWKFGDARLALLAERLVTLGLWHSCEGGWAIHDYAEYQEQALKVNVTDRRERDAERKRQQRTRDKRRESEGSHAVTGCDTRVTASARVPRAQSQETTRSVADARLPLSRPPVPSRPVPTTVTKVTERESARVGQDSTTPTAHAELVRQAWVSEFKSRGLAVDRRLHALTDTEFVKFADGLTLELFKANVARWFADPAMADQGYPVGWFMKNPNQWGAKAKATTRDGGDDRQRPTTTTIPAWMGEQP